MTDIHAEPSTRPWVFRLPGRPQADTHMLTDAIRSLSRSADTSVLDACPGSGAVAITAAQAGAGNVTPSMSRGARCCRLG